MHPDQCTLTNALTGTTLSSLPDGTTGAAYPSLTFMASGGAFVPPVTWSATGLPAGLTVTTANSVGMFSGTPAQSGTFDFTVQLSDALTPPRMCSGVFRLPSTNQCL